MRIRIAIDPGKAGGIAWYNELGSYAIPLPDNRTDMIQAIRSLLNLGLPIPGATSPANLKGYCECNIEKISGYIPQGGASMMFQFGKNVERASCIMEMLGIPFEEVPPKKWQEHLGLGIAGRVRIPSAPKGSTPREKASFKKVNFNAIHEIEIANARAKREWKNRLLWKAQELYPHLKVTLATADCLLLLHYMTITETQSPATSAGFELF